jgi:hypothetical protein
MMSIAYEVIYIADDTMLDASAIVGSIILICLVVFLFWIRKR